MLDVILSLLRDVFFFTGYVGTGSSFPDPLSPDEEAHELKLLSQGDLQARSKLIEHNLRLVAHIAKKYATGRRESDDIISIGTVGLIKAVSTYDAQKGSTLATYAARCIENEILMSLRQEKKSCQDVSLNEPIGVDKDGNEISLAEVLGTDADAIHDEAVSSMASKALRAAMADKLSRREQQVLELRYGLTGRPPMAQREVGALLGISRSYVSRIEKHAIEQLCEVFNID